MEDKNPSYVICLKCKRRIDTDKLKFVDNEIPYEWLWDETVFWHHTLKTIAYDEYGNAASDELDVIISNVKLL